MRRAARRLSSQILVLQLLILTGTVLVGFALALPDVRGRVDREHEQRALVAVHAVAAVRRRSSDAMTGRTVLAVETGTLGRSARAKVPLRADDGRIVGIVSVGILSTARCSSLVHEREAMLHGIREGVVHSRHPRSRSASETSDRPPARGERRCISA